jgi:uncharacterized protein (TIGR00369 family)
MNDATRPAAPAGYYEIESPSLFAALVGPIYLRDEPGDRRCAMRAEEKHCNRRGVVHGGMLMGFADTAFAAIRNMDGPEPSASVTFTFEMMLPANVGDLIEARMKVVRRTGSLNFVRGELIVGEETIVTASTVEKRLRPR